ncbi:MAG TPA: mechanosensitive ion channel domain-containing protein [Verrucomicrobiae bacterium]|nr:mechanosensitive ion channel domain-containing protein [Verrucomicrobiae bacterium]
METAATNTIRTVDAIRVKVIAFLTEYGFQILGALIILAAGVAVAWWIGRVLEDWLENKKIEPPIRMLAVRVTRMLAFGMALVLALEKAGVPIAPVIAGISVAGVGIGLAMQGVLGNLMAGLTIIFTKPFKVGQYIEILTVQGQVTNIELFTTTLLHTDRSKVVIPNRKIVGEILHNYGMIRQLDLTVGVGYATDIEQALQAVRGILQANPRVLKDPAPIVGVVALADSSINIAIKPWTAVADFNPASAEIYQGVVTAFRKQQIDIPFPQREVRLLGEVES